MSGPGIDHRIIFFFQIGHGGFGGRDCRVNPHVILTIKPIDRRLDATNRGRIDRIWLSLLIALRRAAIKDKSSFKVWPVGDKPERLASAPSSSRDRYLPLAAGNFETKSATASGPP
jgi:hypothetical protein